MKHEISSEETLNKLHKLHNFIRAQAWDEALEYSQKITSYYEIDDQNIKYFMLMDAACFRRKGQHAKARELYVKLYDMVSTHDEMFADVEEGLAESYIVTGDFALAYDRAQTAYNSTAAQSSPTSDLGFRVRNQLAHATSYIDLPQSLTMYEAIFKDVIRKEKSEIATSAIANSYFQYGNILFRDAQFDKAAEAIIIARDLAVKSKALKTIADCKRKLPLVLLLSGKREFALDGMLDMDYAQEVYGVIGDRALAYLYTERAELLKALNKYDESEYEYKKSLWAARDINDLIRIAHSNLGLYDLNRVSDIPPNEKHWQEAFNIYVKYNYAWGVVNCLLRKALASNTVVERNDLFNQAKEFIADQSQASFIYELSLINKYENLSLEDGKKQRPLLNWS